MSAPRSYSRSRRIEQTKRTILVVLACAAVIGGFYALSRIGPKSYAVAERRATISKQQAEKLRLLAERAEAHWDSVKKNHRADAPYDDDELAAIGEAAVARFQYENQVEDAGNRYPALKRELHERMGASLRARSIILEKAARGEENVRHYEQAASLYGEALELESLILYDYPESGYADPQRSVNLSGLMRIMTARPLWDRSLSAETAGEAAFARGDMRAAIAGIDLAAKLNYRLDHEFQGFTKADALRSRRLERRLATLNSLEIRTRALAALDKAEKAAASGEYAGLPELRESIETDMCRMADLFPLSDYSSPEVTGDIVRRVQNAASTPDVVALMRDLASFEVAVRDGGSGTARLLENLQRAVQRLREAYPQADSLDKRTDERIGYLFAHRADVASVRSSVLASLRPVPGFPVSIARTETDQRLYSLVMGDNPSAAKGGDRPVESLTRKDAETFCLRLGWLIARKVRLPSEAEFRSAVGKSDLRATTGHARAIDNSDGTAGTVPAAAPDAAGVCDLLGNVAEWLAPEPEDDADAGRIAGGSAEKTLAQLAEIPVESVPAKQISRLIGFRFVVEKLADR